MRARTLFSAAILTALCAAVFYAQGTPAEPKAPEVAKETLDPLEAQICEWEEYYKRLKVTLTVKLGDKPPNALYWSPDGKYLLTAGPDENARLIDPATGKLVRELKGHTANVTDARFAPDGKHVLTASGDWTLRLFAIATGESVREYTGFRGQVNQCCFSPDGKQIAACGEDKTARVYEVESGRIAWDRRYDSSPFRALAWSPDGKVVSLGNDIGWWIDLKSKNGKSEYGRTMNKSPVTKVYFTPSNSHTIALRKRIEETTGDESNDAGSLVFKGRGRDCYDEVAETYGNPTCVSFDESSSFMAVAVDNQAPLIFRLSFVGSDGVLKYGVPDRCTQFGEAQTSLLSISPAGNQLACVTSNGTLSLWSGDNEPKVLPRAKVLPKATFEPAQDEFIDEHFANDPTLKPWIEYYKAMKILKEVAMEGFPSPSIEFDATGEHLLMICQDGPACLYDIVASKIARKFVGNEGTVTCARFSQDFSRVVTGDEKGNVLVFGADSEDAVLKVKLSSAVLSVAVSDNLERVVAGGKDGEIVVWRLKDGAKVWGTQFEGGAAFARTSDEKKAFPKTPVQYVGFSSRTDKEVVAAGRDSTGWFKIDGGSVTSTQDGDDENEFRYTAVVWLDSPSCTVSADSQSVISFGFTRNSEFENSYAYSASTVHSLALNHNRTFLGGGSADGGIRLYPLRFAKVSDPEDPYWDGDTRLAVVLKGHKAKVCGVAFTPDGRYLASLDIKGNLIIWGSDAPFPDDKKTDVKPEDEKK